MTSYEPTSPAEAYHVYYGPAIVGPLSDRILSIVAPSPGDRVLDVAAGTGIPTRKLASLVGPTGRVAGVDVNPAMVDVARRLDGASIHYDVADGAALPFPDRDFDFVYCQQGLQFFTDRVGGAREMRRVLDDGGRAVIACWQGIEAQGVFAALVDAEEPHLTAAGVDVDRAELVAPFAFGDRDELRALLLDAGFSDVSVTEVSIDARFADADRFVERMEYGYAAVIPQFAEEPTAFAAYLAGITEATREMVAAYRQGDEIIIPMVSNVAVATVN